MATKNEVAPIDEKPAYLAVLEGQARDQKDNFDSSDVAIPQIKLLQGPSEQITNFDNARVGEFWHTGMDIPLGKEITFIVCSRRKKYLLQTPLDDGQGVLARADDAKTWDRVGSWEVQIDKKTKVMWTIDDVDVAKSGLAEWGTSEPGDDDSAPAATLFYEYLVILPDYPDLGPSVISLARSAIRKAKKGLNDKIEFHKNNGRPVQALKFTAKSVADQNESNKEFANWQFFSGGYSDEADYHTAVRYSEMLETYSVKDEGKTDDSVKGPNRDAHSDKEI